MIKCPACGFENQDDSAYCEDCGEKLFMASDPVVPSVIGDDDLSSEVMATVSIENMVFPLGRTYNSMGRRSPADGVYPDVDLTDFDHDSYISRRHAQIIKDGNSYYFEDLGSSNGSYLNGEFITKGARQLLKNGDLLKLGKTELVFNLKS